MEISGVEQPQVLEALIDESQKRGISAVMGTTLPDDDDEWKGQACASSQASLTHSVRAAMLLVL